jgi:hypothetical protein
MMHSYRLNQRARWRARWPLCVGLGLVVFAAGSTEAHAQNTTVPAPTGGTGGTNAAGEATGENADELGIGAPELTLDPTAPQTTVLPGGMTPAYGTLPQNPQDWRFDFHGIIIAPLNAGFNSRPDARPGQSTTVLHAPPVVPDDLQTFSHTGVVPTTYAQMNLSDGNGVVSANVSIVAQQANVSQSFLDPSSQLGITDAYLKYDADLGRRAKLRAFVGAFTSRYGSMGEYDEGRYGTPLIARINGAGELISAKLAIGRDTLLLEQGLQGQTNTFNASTTPDVWNDFGNPDEGATFVNHVHAGYGFRSWGTIGAHFINAQSHDDHATAQGLLPDGNLSIVAGDVRLTMGRYGHFYGAFSFLRAWHARTVSRIVNVLNAPGGPGLEANYMGPEPEGDASGTLTIVGGQYDLSVGRLVNYPRQFTGQSRDLFISLFAIGVHVTSPVQLVPGDVNNQVYGDGVTKLKFGGEATYSLLPWLAASIRYDYVAPNIDQSAYSFNVVSPRIILRSNWVATDQISLQYSHWFNGSLTTVQAGEPLIDNLSIVPDADMVSLAASMWW